MYRWLIGFSGDTHWQAYSQQSFNQLINQSFTGALVVAHY